MLKHTLFLAPFVLATVGASEARAQSAEAELRRPGGLSLAVEIGPNVVMDDQGTDEAVGVGVNGRIGYELRSGWVFITPEAKLGFESPGTPNAFRLMGGARAGIATPISPYVFGHIGGLLGDLEGFAWDLGGGVDFDVGPLGLGAFVSYNRAENQTLTLENLGDEEFPWEWVQVGAAVTFVL